MPWSSKSWNGRQCLDFDRQKAVRQLFRKVLESREGYEYVTPRIRLEVIPCGSFRLANCCLALAEKFIYLTFETASF
jgi:hypothetical protein